MDRHRLLYLLQQYEKHALSAMERQELDAWYKQQLEGNLNLFEGLEAEAEQQILFRKIQQNIKTVPVKTMWQHIRQYKHVAGIAAVILIIAGMGLTYINKLQQGALMDNYANKRRVDTAAILLSQVMIKNTTAKTEKHILPDSSIIKLEPGGILVYSMEYGLLKREMQLTGECYFDVHQDRQRPFVVNSGGFSTTALGTSFTIHAPAGTDRVKVHLLSGKVVIKQQLVNISNSISQVYLQPGQQFDGYATSGLYTVNTITEKPAKERKRIFVTTSDQLYHTGYENNYDRIALPLLLEDLKNGYNTSIKYKEKDISEMQFSGMIRKSDTLSGVLRRIALLNDLQLQQTGKNEYQLSKNNP